MPERLSRLALNRSLPYLLLFHRLVLACSESVAETFAVYY